MKFTERRDEFEQELSAYYGAPALDVSAWEQELHEQCREHPGRSPFEHKMAGYEFMAERCPVHVFQHCPFYFEINTGRERTDLGTGGMGGWLKREPFGQELCASSTEWWTPCWESGLSSGWAVLDDNHHTIGYEAVLRLGLRGLIRKAEERLATASPDSERDFLAATMAGNRALIRVAERMAVEAERLLQDATGPHVRERLARIADAARRVPAEPAVTFYEALNTILFLFYVLPSIEGNGASVFGHVDRILISYYRRDREAGRLAEGQARDLVSSFLALSDARYGMRHAGPWQVGTNGTITLGGCGRDGTPVFNELTRMFLDVHRELRLVDPKVNVRLSSQHPAECFDLVARAIAGGSNALAIFNDDVVIPANARVGKALEDCRLYVGGGCQENVLENCEVNSRATIYLNLLHVFLMGFFPRKWDFFCGRAGIDLAEYSGCATYDALHDAFLRNLRAVVDAHIDERNRTEREGARYNPCPLHSSALDDCIANARDMMEAGCRYNYGSVALTGIGTLVDSLFAVKAVVYDRALIPLAELGDMLEGDFDGQETFRSFLANRIAKFGQANSEIREFSARVFADVARVSSGKPNSRGGRYEASLFSFRSFTHFGAQTGATPDGRRAGEHLSGGMSPSLLALGEKAGVGQVLAALEPLDLALYPVVAVLDVKLPAAKGGLPAAVVTPVIRRFIDAGGSVLQINCVDQAVLKEARVHPERHPDLIVRVSGYSGYFTSLAEPIQDEIIARTLTEA